MHQQQQLGTLYTYMYCMYIILSGINIIIINYLQSVSDVVCTKQTGLRLGLFDLSAPRDKKMHGAQALHFQWVL